MLIRKTPLHDLEGGLPVVDTLRSHAFVVMTGGASGVATFDTRTGALLHVTQFGAQARIDLVLSQRTGRLYAAILDGRGLWRIAAIDERTGRATRIATFSRALGAGITLAADDRRDLVFVAFTQEFSLPNALPVAGTLRVLDARTNRLRPTLALGAGTVQLAVDQASDRLLMLTTGGIGFGPPPDRWGWLPSRLRVHIPFVPPPPGDQVQAANRITILDISRL